MNYTMPLNCDKFGFKIPNSLQIYETLIYKLEYSNFTNMNEN